MRLVWSTFLVGTLFLASVATQSPPPFHVETRLVVVYVSVKNQQGALVTTLDRDAFTVFEDGKPQPITMFRRDDIPVSIGLLIDNSGSMRNKRKRVEAAALAFVGASNPQDEVFVLNFADKPHVDVGFTSDIRVLEAGLGRVDSIGGTAMRDAIDLAEQYLDQHATRDRRALLVVTDGNDNASVTTASRIQTRAEQRSIVIYSVGLLNDEDQSKAKRARLELDRLAAATGGVAYYPGSVDAITEAVLDLAHQIRNQYTIGYTPLNQALDGSFRKLKVVANGRERLIVQARAGYRAAESN